MGTWLADVARHDAWALWLAAPAVGIALVCLGVWWWSRPARPATTSRSIAGHHAYLDALGRPARERVEAPVGDAPAETAEPLTRVVVHDPDAPAGTTAPAGTDPPDDPDHDPDPAADDLTATVTLHA